MLVGRAILGKDPSHLLRQVNALLLSLLDLKLLVPSNHVVSIVLRLGKLYLRLPFWWLLYGLGRHVRLESAHAFQWRVGILPKVIVRERDVICFHAVIFSLWS